MPTARVTLDARMKGRREVIRVGAAVVGNDAGRPMKRGLVCSFEMPIIVRGYDENFLLEPFESDGSIASSAILSTRKRFRPSRLKKNS